MQVIEYKHIIDWKTLVISMTVMLRKVVALAGLVGFGLCSSVAMGSNLDNLAKSLAKIRGEVEELQSELDAQKENHRSHMTALSSQLADLSVEERRQKVSIEKLTHSIEEITKNSAQAKQSSEQLKPVLLEMLANYKQYVSSGLPFKVEDRLQAIKSLEDNIVNGLVDPNKAANQAWALIEDEIRLSKENGIYQQTIMLDGEKVLADIAKLGSVFLFFQTRDSRSGVAQKSEFGQWVFKASDSNQEIEQIAVLFDSLKKQIRQGYFELPNPLKK